MRKLERTLDDHRSLDKVAVLLKLHGYDVSAAALRRALRHLLIEPLELDRLDPSHKRSFGSTAAGRAQAGATAAAANLLSERSRTSDERRVRADELDRAGGRSALEAHYASLLLPTFGALDRDSLWNALDTFGLGLAARTLAAGIPEGAEALAELADAGELRGDRLRSHLNALESEQFDILVRGLRVLVMTLERLGLNITPTDRFKRDVFAAVRAPEHWRRADSSKPGAAEEAAAIRYFASRRPMRITPTKT